MLAVMDWIIVKDFAIPAASILIPSIIAISLAAAERRAAQRERELNEKRGQTARVNAAIGEALDAMSDLVESAYQDDFREAARFRFVAARRLARIHDGMAEAAPSLFNWITEELGLVGLSLEDRNEYGLATQGTEIVWRAAEFGTKLTEWRIGNVPDSWFETAEHKPIADTVEPKKPPRSAATK